MKTPDDVSMEVAELRSLLAVALAKQEAAHMALLGVVESFAAALQLSFPGTSSVHAYYLRQKIVEMEKYLIRIEDADPGTAAKLQSAVDEMRKDYP